MLVKNLPMLASFALLALALSACQLPPVGGRASPQLYQLALDESPVTAASGEGNGILVIERPQAAPGYDTARIAYQVAAHELRYYRESRWADTPSRMLEPALVDALESSGLFRAVVSPTSTVAPDYQLATDLLLVQQRFDSDGNSHARLRMRITLLDLRSDEVLGTRMIDIRKPAPTPDASGGVIAANQALQEAVRQLQPFIKNLLGAADSVADRRP